MDAKTVQVTIDKAVPRWDIFCAVVDNFGDVGVCWRLARQLAAEYNLSVRLWVDQLAPFRALCPTLQECDQQWLEGVDVRHWQGENCTPETSDGAADVVVEGFACNLPAAYIEAMAAREQAPIWFNLEYLTAEPWADEYHSLPSIDAQTGLRKVLFVPGFSAHTGGILRERDVIERRDQWQSHSTYRSLFLKQLNVQCDHHTRLVSLFSYENSALPELLRAMEQFSQKHCVLVPMGRVVASIESYLGESLPLGQAITRGALTVQAIPFLAQAEYDHLLWSCDFNIVRGEDSLVRALWAGKPLLWHIYPQEGEHLIKLQAFLTRYTEGLTPEQAAAVTALWMAWNTQASMVEPWQQALAELPTLSRQARSWALLQSGKTDLAAKMVQFCTKLV